MERPLRDLYAFALKFARMKAVYDAASQAAVQRASEVTRVHCDIVVKTPILVLPRDGLASSDILILRLGEIVAKNDYLHDPDDTSTIDASLRGISVAAEIMVDNADGRRCCYHCAGQTGRWSQSAFRPSSCGYGCEEFLVMESFTHGSCR